MSVSDIAKRAYGAVALFSVLNLLGLGGLVGWLVGSETLDADRARAIVAVLQGAEVAEPVDETSTPQAEAEAEAQPVAEFATDAEDEARSRLAIMHREAERIKEELRQQLALANSIMLRVQAERDAYRQERDLDKRQDDAVARRRKSEGFLKQVAILRGLKPKTSAEFILGMSDTADAAELLLAMDTRDAKKIIEAARGPEQMAQMREVLERMQGTEPDRPETLQGG